MYPTERIRKLTFLALMTAAAVILGGLEIYVCIIPSLPGVKLGLPNIFILFILYRFGFREGFAVSVLKTFIVTFMFGTGSSFIYSITGAVMSVAVMGIIKKFSCFSPIGTSLAGSFCHITSQLLCSAVVLGSAKVFCYFPALIFSSIISGFIIGAATLKMLNTNLFNVQV